MVGEMVGWSVVLDSKLVVRRAEWMVENLAVWLVVWKVVLRGDYMVVAMAMQMAEKKDCCLAGRMAWH